MGYEDGYAFIQAQVFLEDIQLLKPENSNDLPFGKPNKDGNFFCKVGLTQVLYDARSRDLS